MLLSTSSPWRGRELRLQVPETSDDASQPECLSLTYDMALSVGTRDSVARGRHVTGKATIPPRTMEAIRLRYPRQVQQGELFAVEVECAIVRIRNQTAKEQQLASIQG